MRWLVRQVWWLGVLRAAAASWTCDFMQVEVTTGIALTGPVAYMPTCHCGYLLTRTYTVAKMSTYMYSHVLTIAPTVRIITGQAEIMKSQNVHRQHQTITTKT